MATSSITTNFTIGDTKVAQAFATAVIRKSGKLLNTKLSTRAIVWMICCACSSLIAAIPTATECKAAREKLAELTADDYKALKAKTKTNEQVGDALLGYADNEESVAGKFALLQDAFQQYVLGKSVDKADSAYSKALAIGGVEYALEMARPARSKLSAYATSKNASTKALKERIAADEKSFQRVGIVKAKLKKAPGDESLCEQLGIEYAAIGDWESALAAFVTAAGEVAKVADWELNGGKGSDYTAATAGAFWWKFAGNFPKRKNVEETMKLHAAMWYKLALDKDAFKGNEKTIIEKRIAETEKFGAAEQQEKEVAAKKMEALAPIKLEFSKDNVVELIGCPAGEFMMGHPKNDKKDSPVRCHKVVITRSFYMSKYKVSHKVWSRYQKYELSNQDEILGGWKCAHIANQSDLAAFMEWLNKFSSFKKLIPKGYVFRLPTEAEWEYALRANVTDKDDLFYRYLNGELRNASEIAVGFGDVCALYKEKGLKANGDAWNYKPIAVDVKAVNRWGFCGMLGNWSDCTLDRVDQNKKSKYDYADEEKDPLRWFDGASAGCVIRGLGESYDPWWSFSAYNKNDINLSEAKAFHIVLGPDLMKEKGYEKKAQKKR